LINFRVYYLFPDPYKKIDQGGIVGDVYDGKDTTKDEKEDEDSDD
jgi:hypothetical protein